MAAFGRKDGISISRFMAPQKVKNVYHIAITFTSCVSTHLLMVLFSLDSLPLFQGAYLAVQKNIKNQSNKNIYISCGRQGEKEIIYFYPLFVKK